MTTAKPSLFIIALILGASMSQEVSGWSMDQETYSCYTSGMTLQEMANGGVTVISHTPATREYCEEAHRWGLKVIPYVSLYKVIDSTKGKHLLKHPFWKEVDASKHPEWYLIRPDGKVRRPFDNPNYSPPLQQSCCNHQSLIEAYERGVRNVMEIGADGVFVDNVHPYPVCYGQKLGIHKHDWPDKNNTECYKIALMRVYKLVKGYGEDRVVMLNSGGPSESYIGYGDSLMWESYVWRSGFKGDTGPFVKTRRWTSWPNVLKGYNRWKAHVAEGVSIAPLTYLPDPDLEAENAFFAYGCAKLSGFNQWTATCNRRRDILRRLYRTRLGKPTGPLVQQNGLAYRRYEHGLVVVNPAKTPLEADVPAPEIEGSIAELFTGREITVKDGKLHAALPPESGRVFLTKQKVLLNFLREVEGQAVASRLRIEKIAKNRRYPALDQNVSSRLQTIERTAIELQQLLRESGQLDAQKLRALTLEAVEPKDLGDIHGIEQRLLASAKKLTVDKASKLATVPSAASPEIEVSKDEILLKSAGAVYTIRCEGTTLARVGDIAFQLWVAPPPKHKTARWLHPKRLTDVKVAVNTPERKRVTARVVLYGRNTQEEVDDLHVEISAEVHRGSRELRLDCFVVNDAEPYDCYAFLTPGLGWQTDRTLGTVNASTAPDQRRVSWVYLHRRKRGGGGVLLTRLPTIGKSGGSSYIFGHPKVKRLAKGEKFDLSITVCPVYGAAQDNKFLEERMGNIRCYAALAAQLAGKIYLNTSVPQMPVPGSIGYVSLSIDGPGTAEVAGVEFDLTTDVNGSMAAVSRLEAEQHHARFRVKVAPGISEGSGVHLHPVAQLTFRDGNRARLEDLRDVKIPKAIAIKNGE